MLDETDMMRFGHLPFDYVMEYPDGDKLFPEEIPPHVPQDLMSDEEHAKDGQTTRLSGFGHGSGGEMIKQARMPPMLDISDYARLFLGMISTITMPDGDTNLDFVDGVACGTPGYVPSYMITGLMHKPNTLDGLSAHVWPEESYERPPELDMVQCLMLVIADRKACEEGWILFFAVNHKREVISFRIRERASWTSQLIMEFMNGQALDENTEDPSEETESYMRGGDGWAPENVL
ncbi:hypothetical protein N7517_011136 [Penicillium concentricum]|uniref:Uncharacterized protein n=1 Tax=Penicillium concentricum TaxID=293559 RepID=A0A9W9RAA9_9EURO|nr:uncharacterized protein N7517_011136 [Penicillium concentricum]KAJ5356527.1 hypothetical protein N7517_011136 [Penicillium concentricum]